MKKRDESIVWDLVRAFPRLAFTIALGIVVVLGIFVWRYGPSAYYSFLSFSSLGDVPSVEGAPREAVVRVSAPRGETYRIQWGEGLLPPVETGTIDPALGYRDHPINPRAVDPSGRYVITIHAGDGVDYPYGEPDTEVGAGLFISDSYEVCKKEEREVRLEWMPSSYEASDPNAGLWQRVQCGSYRYSIP